MPQRPARGQAQLAAPAGSNPGQLVTDISARTDYGPAQRPALVPVIVARHTHLTSGFTAGAKFAAKVPTTVKSHSYLGGYDKDTYSYGNRMRSHVTMGVQAHDHHGESV